MDLAQVCRTKPTLEKGVSSLGVEGCVVAFRRLLHQPNEGGVLIFPRPVAGRTKYILIRRLFWLSLAGRVLCGGVDRRRNQLPPVSPGVLRRSHATPKAIYFTSANMDAVWHCGIPKELIRRHLAHVYNILRRASKSMQTNFQLRAGLTAGIVVLPDRSKPIEDPPQNARRGHHTS